MEAEREEKLITRREARQRITRTSYGRRCMRVCDEGIEKKQVEVSGETVEGTRCESVCSFLS